MVEGIPNDFWAGIVALVVGGAVVIGVLSWLADAAGGLVDTSRKLFSVRIDIRYPEDGSRGTPPSQHDPKIRGTFVAGMVRDGFVYKRLRIPAKHRHLFAPFEFTVPDDFYDKKS